jgi:hypothetical protein
MRRTEEHIGRLFLLPLGDKKLLRRNWRIVCCTKMGVFEFTFELVLIFAVSYFLGKRFAKRMREPKPSDYIGRFPSEVGWAMVTGEALKRSLMKKRKQEELKIIRELEPGEGIRRIP